MSYNFYIKIYGCAMNYADADKIRKILETSGGNEVYDENQADVIILVSCSVRQKPEDRVSGLGIKYLEPKFSNKTVILTGCMAVRHDRESGEKADLNYTKKLARKLNWIDSVLDIQDIHKLPAIITKKRSYKNYDKNDESVVLARYLHLKQPNSNKITGLFPISTGCNNFCSYCIVPYARGKLVDYPFEKIFEEVKDYVSKGGKLVTLLGQNVNSWRDGKKDFSDLLQSIAALKGDFWINFLSSNPMDFSEQLVDVVCGENKIMKWLNLAVQSGSNRILKKMNRKYSVEEFIKIVNSIKSRVPDFRLTTDMIVGFPGETEEDFQKSLNLVKEINFDMVYVGKYSPRPGTFSAKNYVDNISEDAKVSREQAIKDAVNKIRIKNHRSLEGKSLKALVISKRKAVSYLNHDVLFQNPVAEDLIGNFSMCEVIGSSVSGITAKILGK